MEYWLRREDVLMMSTLYYGEIRPDKLATWSDNDNPYKILVENHEIPKVRGWKFLFDYEKLFFDKVQVDWGSFAYKGTKEQILKLMELVKCESDEVNNPVDCDIYGIVFVEEY